MSYELAQERVALGAALLDEKLPGWHDQIDTQSLNMASECNCVLGQLGSMKVNLDRLGWEGEPAFNEEYDGFTILTDILGVRGDEIGCDSLWTFTDPADTGVMKELITFSELRDAWVDVIEKRRANA